ncbi:MAG: right-handed parallel beta-helix repeat-containing protein [Candidatus Marinimicrobia bacterium]|nr:right-handed parallel beta-helix repeat-containing protein [Candidatus Neomarinimicrobiota bacterium]
MKKLNVVILSVLVFSVSTNTTTAWSPTSMALQPGTTFVVTSTSDSGSGSLREAIGSALSGDSITFDPSVFPPAAPDTIFLTSELPRILQGNLVIDASDAGVIIDGSMITTPEAYGFSISSNNNIIRGLQILYFSQAGIGLSGGAQYNTIGGDQNIGEGPLGQGNLISGDGTFGIGLWNEGTSFNTIQGNVIGTDPSGTTRRGEFSGGIFIDGANYNLVVGNLIGGYVDHGVSIFSVIDGHNTVRGNYIGTNSSGMTVIDNSGGYGISISGSGFNVVVPANVIAYNGGSGIAVFGEESVGNRITQNSIHDNGHRGIDLSSGGNTELSVPFILDFDLQAGSLTGWAYPNSIVEIFSDSSYEGAFYEAQAVADSRGFFTFRKEAAFTGPHLTTTATDPDGNTSEFSGPTEGISGSFSHQEGNSLAMTALQSKASSQLVDDVRLGKNYYFSWGDLPHLVDSAEDIYRRSVKRINIGLNEVEPPIIWSNTETDIPVEFDQFIDGMNENKVAVNYLLHFWDKIGHAAGEDIPDPRFTTEEEIQEFLDYVRLIVGHFKGRVQYYTVWSEPDNCGSSLTSKCIEPLDYVNLVRQTIPVIREVDSLAKVVTGPVVLYFGRDHLFTLLRSDAIQLFDVISTHPLYDAAPDQEFVGFVGDEPLESYGEYYYNYPTIIDSIRQTASAHGFQGQYWGEDVEYALTENLPHVHWPGHTWLQNAKYTIRAIVMHLGLDAGVGVYSPSPALYTILNGTEPINLGVEIESEATNIVSYGFTNPDGDKLLALWTDGAAVDYDPGVTATLTFPGVSASRVTSIDVLNGFQQEMITEVDNGNLVIRNLMVKDYPIILSTASVQNVENGISPFNFTLFQNYPNPFNPLTIITYELKENAQVSLKIYNILGQSVRTLVDEKQFEGSHSIQWNGKDQKGIDVASSLYFYKLETKDFVKVRKMLLIR